ncbi:MAG TPA: acyltransferase [Opitutaceae bacterium]|nr:acyltransferase [Opitutaceae bacterium]
MKPLPASTLQAAPPVPRGVRLPALDGLKGVAMALVLCYHAGGVLGWENTLHGEVGVDVFLLVSGVLLAVNSFHLSPGEFLKRRFLRIYPSYWAALLLYLWLNSKYYADNRSPADIGLHFLGLHAFGSPLFFSSVNDSFWFISVIVLLYAAFFALRPRLHELSFVVGVGGLLTLGLWVYYQETNNAGGLAHLACRVPTAFLGLILGQLFSGRPTQVRLTLFGAAGLAALAYACLWRQLSLDYPLIGLAWGAVFLAVETKLRRFHPGRVLLAGLSLLGIYSYEIYLLHQPVIRDYNRLFLFQEWGIQHPTPRQLELSMAAAFALVVGVSVLLHQATEILFRRMRRA